MINWGCSIGWTAISGSQLNIGETKDVRNVSNITIQNATEVSYNNDLQLNNEQISWLGASFAIGGLVGALSAGIS